MLRDCKPWQMTFAVASTSYLCFTLSFENGVDLASVPLIISCVDVFTTEVLLCQVNCHCSVAGAHGVPEHDTAVGGTSG